MRVSKFGGTLMLFVLIKGVSYFKGSFRRGLANVNEVRAFTRLLLKDISNSRVFTPFNFTYIHTYILNLI